METSAAPAITVTAWPGCPSRVLGAHPDARENYAAYLETGGYRYQIFTLGSPRPSQSDNVIYATRKDAERAGQVAAAILL